MGWLDSPLLEQLEEEVVERRVERPEDEFDMDIDGIEGSPSGFLEDHGSLLSFSTDRAFYHIHPGENLSSWDVETILDESDGIVLETGPYRSFDLEILSENDLYENIIEESLERQRKSIFLVDSQGRDMDVTDREEALEYLEEEGKRSLSRGVGAVTTLYSILRKRFKFMPFALSLATDAIESLARFGLFKNTNSYLQLKNFYKKDGGRSAVAAEKLEEFVAPRLAEEAGEKPDIFVEYTSGHLDMKHYLKNERLRNGVTALHDAVNRIRSDGEYRDKVGEIRFDGFVPGPVNEHIVDGETFEYQKIIYELEE